MINSSPIVRSYKGQRSRYETTRSFDDVLVSLRAAVGVATRNELGDSVRARASKEAFTQRMQEIAGDSGFMLFYEMDHGAWLKTFGIERKVMRWIFGNPVIAYTMLKHDVAAGLFAPIEFLLVDNESGHGATLIYDLPSSLMVIEENPPLLEAAQALDRKFAALIERVM
jgi:uncharacterized protein (DUF302 family)